MNKRPIQVYPSILSGDFGNLAEEAKRIEKAGADGIHIDIMDGHFVPNLTFGPKAVAAINRSTELFLDIHLMIYNPYDYIEAFVASGADRITFHFEATEDVEETIEFVKRCCVKSGERVEVGLAFRPETSFSLMAKYLEAVDQILIMTVNPGFGGQAFMPEMLEKIELARKLSDKVKIQVDGGINDVTAAQCIKAGADVLVSGEYLFRQPRLEDGILALKKCD